MCYRQTTHWVKLANTRTIMDDPKTISVIKKVCRIINNKNVLKEHVGMSKH